MVANASRTSARPPARAASGYVRAAFVCARGFPRTAAASGYVRAVFVCARGFPRAAAKHAHRQQRRIPLDGGIAARARVLQRVDLRGTETRADRATADACAAIFL